jgi:hypothetical protein
MNATAWRLCPAGQAADAIFNFFLAQVHDFNVCAYLAHAFNQGIEHHDCVTVFPAAWAGIQSKYFHTASFGFNESVGV